MPQATGRKWDPALAVAEAKAGLRHQDIMGQVQHGRRGLDLGTTTPTWQKATPYGVEEVYHQPDVSEWSLKPNKAAE